MTLEQKLMYRQHEANELHREMEMEENERADKEEADKKRIQELIHEAETMPIKEVIHELKGYGMNIDDVHDEDRLVEMYVMCSLHEMIVATGEWDHGNLGEGVYADPKSPVKMRKYGTPEEEEEEEEEQEENKVEAVTETVVEEKKALEEVKAQLGDAFSAEGEEEKTDSPEKKPVAKKERSSKREKRSKREKSSKREKRSQRETRSIREQVIVEEKEVVVKEKKAVDSVAVVAFEEAGGKEEADETAVNDAEEESSSSSSDSEQVSDLSEERETSPRTETRARTASADSHDEQVRRTKVKRRAMANILFLKDNVRHAARLELKELLHLNPKSAELMKRLGVLCLDKNPGVEGANLRRRAAMILLERALLSKKYENDAVVCRTLATVHFDVWVKEGAKSSPIHLERAKFCWDKCLRSLDVATDPIAWEQAALVHLYLGDYEGASNTLDQLIKNFPRYENLGRVKVTAASLFMGLQKFQEAKSLLYGAMVRGAGGGGFGVLEMTFFTAILHESWAKKLRAEGEGEINENVATDMEKTSKAGFREAIGLMQEVGEDGIGEAEVEEMLKEAKVWRFFGDSAVTKGFGLLAVAIFEAGVDATGGAHASLWLALAKCLKKCGKLEDAIDAANEALALEPAGKNSAQIALLLSAWNDEDHDELYHEEMEASIGTVLDEYVVYERENDAFMSPILTEVNSRTLEKPERKARGTHKSVKGRRKSSVFMEKRENKWKLLTMDSSISIGSCLERAESGRGGLGTSMRSLRGRRSTLRSEGY